MNGSRALLEALGVEGAVAEGRDKEPGGMVLWVRVAWRPRWRCPVCGGR